MVFVAVHTGNRDIRDVRAQATAWRFENFTENAATINCDGASNDQLADALATLVGQLIDKGILIGVVGTGTP